MDNVEFIDSTGRARRNLALLYGGGILLGALLVGLVRPALLEVLHDLPICDQAAWSVRIVVTTLSPLPFAAVWLALHARNLLKFDQSPLPNAWVWRRTRIKRGRSVQMQAYALLFCAAVLLVAPLGAWFALQPLWSTLRLHCGA